MNHLWSFHKSSHKHFTQNTCNQYRPYTVCMRIFIVTVLIFILPSPDLSMVLYCAVVSNNWRVQTQWSSIKVHNGHLLCGLVRQSPVTQQRCWITWPLGYWCHCPTTACGSSVFSCPDPVHMRVGSGHETRSLDVWILGIVYTAPNCI